MSALATTRAGGDGADGDDPWSACPQPGRGACSWRGGRGGGVRHRPALRGQLRHVARRGPDAQHRPAAARADPRRPAPRRRAAAVLLPAPLLDAAPSGPPTRRCARCRGCSAAPPCRSSGWRVDASAARRWQRGRSSSWPPRPSPSATPPRTACTPWWACSPPPGVVALQHVFRRRTVANVVAVALLTGLLLYTHYWALYLVGVTALWLAFQAWRGPDASAGPGPGWRSWPCSSVA